jgi:hypothetical protein
MRLYGTRHIEATIRQKTVATKYGVKARPLTAEDFEIVPAHDEECLVECRCDICGGMAAWFDTESPEASGSSLNLLQVSRGAEECESDDVTDEFFDEGYEVCDVCMRTKVLPALNNLRCTPLPLATVEEPSGLAGPGEPLGSTIGAGGRLLGAEEGRAPSPLLPPLSADEPF